MTGILLYLMADIDNTVEAARNLIERIFPSSETGQDSAPEQPYEPPPASSGAPSGQAGTPPEPEEDGTAIGADKYIYHQLNAQQQAVYRKLYAALLNSRPNTFIPADVSGSLGEFELIDLFDAVLDDHPEIFWPDNEIVVRTQTVPGTDSQPVEVQFRYLFEGAERDRVQARIDAYTADCLADAPWDGSDFDKILHVYEYVIHHTEYDLESDNNQSVVSVMLDGQSVCKGYAKSVQYLANLMDIPCVTINGYAVGQGAHSWNLILADGEYYYLDATWGDPEMDGPDMDFDNIKYDYFLLTGEEISVTHTPSVKYPLPDCTATRLNYYNHTGRMFDSYEYGGILSLAAGDAAAGLDKTTFRFSSRDAYDAALTALFEGGDFFSVLSDAGIGIPGESISYLLNDALNIVTVVFR